MKLVNRLKNHAAHDAEAEIIRVRLPALEDCRDSISPIRVLHDAVTLSDVPNMGPMLTSLEPAEGARVRPVAKALLAIDGGIANTMKLAA